MIGFTTHLSPAHHLADVTPGERQEGPDGAVTVLTESWTERVSGDCSE